VAADVVACFTANGTTINPATSRTTTTQTVTAATVPGFLLTGADGVPDVGTPTGGAGQFGGPG
jgi:hypothetical protein